MSKNLPKDWIGKCPILLHGVHGMTCQVCPDSSSLNKDLAAVVHWRLKGPKPGLAWLSNDDDQWCRARALITQWPKLSGRVLCRAGWCQVGYKAARAVPPPPPPPSHSDSHMWVCLLNITPSQLFWQSRLKCSLAKQAPHSARPRDLLCSLGPTNLSYCILSYCLCNQNENLGQKLASHFSQKLQFFIFIIVANNTIKDNFSGQKKFWSESK